MRLLCAVVAFFILCVSAHADEREMTDEELYQVSAEITDIYNQVDTDNKSNLLMSANSAEFQQLKSDCIKEYPELNELLKDKPEHYHPDIIRAFLAEKTFEQFKSRYMADIEKRSLETGRRVITKYYKDNKMMVHLDRGILDTEECRLDFENRRVCDYPDGFEEYMIFIRWAENVNGYAIKNISVTKDLPNDNIRIELIMRLKTKSDISYDQEDYKYKSDVGLTFSGLQWDYHHYHEWRNQDAADIRNGKMIRCTQNDNKGRSAMFKCAWKQDDSREWKSSHRPGFRVTSVRQNYTSGGTSVTNSE